MRSRPKGKGSKQDDQVRNGLIVALVNGIAAMDVAADFIYYQNAPIAPIPLRRIPLPRPRRILGRDPRFHLFLWALRPLRGVNPRLQNKKWRVVLNNPPPPPLILAASWFA